MNLVSVLKLVAVLCTAAAFGRFVSKIRLPSILGWLIAGMVFGPYLAGVVDQSVVDGTAYKIFVKFSECFAGVMIGREIVFKKLKAYGKQVAIITVFQSLGTFALVTAVFAVVFAIAKIPLYLAFIFGGIALATAPAPALSIVNEFKCDGPVTKTLIPLAALDDVIGVAVFFTVISAVSSMLGQGAVSGWRIALMLLLPFATGIAFGAVCGGITTKLKNPKAQLTAMIVLLCACVVAGLLCDRYIFGSFTLNYLLIGMAFSATAANLVPEEKFEKILRLYNPLLSLSLIIVIVNLGMPLDYRAIAGAGIYTVVYILGRAAGKIGGAALGGRVAKAQPTVKKYLGLTLLPHSGVSLVFTGIAVSTLSGVNAELTAVIQGTIAAAAVINEIIAVILSKQAFKWAGELGKAETGKPANGETTEISA